MIADQGGQKNRNGKTIAVLFLPCFLLVMCGHASTSFEDISFWCFGDMVVFVFFCNRNPFVPIIKGKQGKTFTICAYPNHVRNQFPHHLLSSCEFLHSHCIINV
jgi:hypothetical protein